jgi:NADH dehydrogenase FAD-containing subunit
MQETTMKKLFGTDGVRGVANIYPMTSEIAMQIGRAIAFIVKNQVKGNTIVIGKDTRLSGYMLENALAAGICSMGQCPAGGTIANAGHRLYHHFDAGRRRGGDLGLAQPLPGQRHQDIFRRWLQTAR